MKITFIIDTSVAMNQLTWNGISLLDRAKAAVNCFLKERKDEAIQDTDLINIITFEENLNGSFLKESFINIGEKNSYIQNLKARDKDNMLKAVAESLLLNHCDRMVKRLDSFGCGRKPWLIQPEVIIVITHKKENGRRLRSNSTKSLHENISINDATSYSDKAQSFEDKLSHLLKSSAGTKKVNIKDSINASSSTAQMTNLVVPPPVVVASLPGTEYLNAIHRWDQRLYVINLTAGGLEEITIPGRISSSINELEDLDGNVLYKGCFSKSLHLLSPNITELDKFAFLTGGTSVNTKQSHKIICGHLESICHSFDKPGVMSLFKAYYRNNNNDNSNIKSQNSNLSMLQLRGECGQWPIPDNYYPDVSLSSIPSRPAHPILYHKASPLESKDAYSMEKMINELKFHEDVYDIEDASNELKAKLVDSNSSLGSAPIPALKRMILRWECGVVIDSHDTNKNKSSTVSDKECLTIGNGSENQNTIFKPFGYLKLEVISRMNGDKNNKNNGDSTKSSSSSSLALTLHILPFNYPILLKLLYELYQKQNNNNKTSSSTIHDAINLAPYVNALWKERFYKYFETIPHYYYNIIGLYLQNYKLDYLMKVLYSGRNFHCFKYRSDVISRLNVCVNDAKMYLRNVLLPQRKCLASDMGVCHTNSNSTAVRKKEFVDRFAARIRWGASIDASSSKTSHISHQLLLGSDTDHNFVTSSGNLLDKAALLYTQCIGPAPYTTATTATTNKLIVRDYSLSAANAFTEIQNINYNSNNNNSNNNDNNSVKDINATREEQFILKSRNFSNCLQTYYDLATHIYGERWYTRNLIRLREYKQAAKRFNNDFGNNNTITINNNNNNNNNTNKSKSISIDNPRIVLELTPSDTAKKRDKDHCFPVAVMGGQNQYSSLFPRLQKEVLRNPMEFNKQLPSNQRFPYTPKNRRKPECFNGNINVLSIDEADGIYFKRDSLPKKNDMKDVDAISPIRSSDLILSENNLNKKNKKRRGKEELSVSGGVYIPPHKRQRLKLSDDSLQHLSDEDLKHHHKIYNDDKITSNSAASSLFLPIEKYESKLSEEEVHSIRHITTPRNIKIWKNLLQQKHLGVIDAGKMMNDFIKLSKV